MESEPIAKGDDTKPDADEGSSTCENVQKLEECKKLEIRLSRLPEGDTEPKGDSATDFKSPPPSTVPLTTKSDPLKQKFQSWKPLRSTPASPASNASTSAGLKSEARKRAIARRKKSSRTVPVKIKINFLTRKLAKAVGASQKSSVDNEVDFETRERDAAAEATKKMLEDSRLKTEDEVSDPRFTKPSLPSSPDGSSESDSEASEEEYLFRPRRAAAAAALRKLDSDSDSFKGSQSQRKPFGLFPFKTVPKGKGRRTISKRASVQKGIRRSCLPEVQYTHYVHSVFNGMIYYQIGDIVSTEGKFGTYYCQILNLVQNINAQHFAEVAWLVPTTFCQASPFNPKDYERRDDLAPEILNLDDVNFVTHFPYNYYNEAIRQPHCSGPQNVVIRMSSKIMELEIPEIVQEPIKIESVDSD